MKIKIAVRKAAAWLAGCVAGKVAVNSEFTNYINYDILKCKVKFSMSSSVAALGALLSEHRCRDIAVLHLITEV